ncbi:MAG: bifunctional methylenetetrahydrofolate dehydrogenase/methenyltetrahydrofolate cyclohydrolase FolD [Candidatus Tectomicrobia bacterium]|nr:bifunctional methylenetetrahydrofolate dehydrogenase/methenyltetrahydrofolate cyclohydrolase FolD [Candidatus Tectomicrobia bacterium]
MPAQILDGKKIGQAIRDGIRREIDEIARRGEVRPKLAVVLVGEDPASQIYVRNKQRACREAGIETEDHLPSADVSQSALANLVSRLNEDPTVHGILVQLPLPKHIEENLIIEGIQPQKDVDGFHPYNLGKLILGEDALAPATPCGVIAMLDSAGIEIQGKNVTVVGRSRIVGKPLAALFLNRSATVTVCHSKTRDLKEECRRADIVVAAVGKARLIGADHVREGAVVIDVGINRVGDKWVGDVDFDAVVEKAAVITPVPGGVGPMTITMLLANTLKAYRLQRRDAGRAASARMYD